MSSRGSQVQQYGSSMLAEEDLRPAQKKFLEERAVRSPLFLAPKSLRISSLPSSCLSRVERRNFR